MNVDLDKSEGLTFDLKRRQVISVCRESQRQLQCARIAAALELVVIAQSEGALAAASERIVAPNRSVSAK